MVRLAAWPTRRWIALGLDAVIVFAAYFGGLSLRFDGAVPGVYWSNFAVLMPWVVVAFIGVNLCAGAYASPATNRVVVSALATGVAVALVMIALPAVLPLPLSVLILGAGGSFAGIVAARFVVRP